MSGDSCNDFPLDCVAKENGAACGVETDPLWDLSGLLAAAAWIVISASRVSGRETRLANAYVRGGGVPSGVTASAALRCGWLRNRRSTVEWEISPRNRWLRPGWGMLAILDSARTVRGHMSGKDCNACRCTLVLHISPERQWTFPLPRPKLSWCAMEYACWCVCGSWRTLRRWKFCTCLRTYKSVSYVSDLSAKSGNLAKYVLVRNPNGRVKYFNFNLWLRNKV